MVQIACDSISGECVTATKNDGETCDTGSACNELGVCDAGECSAPFISCDDGNPCTEDQCDDVEGCQHDAIESGSCDDGDVCTEADVCVRQECATGPR